MIQPVEMSIWVVTESPCVEESEKKTRPINDPDRKDAIRKGVSMLDKNDILLVLGKGHENYQIINGIKYHFNDKEEVLKSIKT